MELKKTKKADLEKNRGIFLEIALIASLSLTLIAFDWKTEPKQGDVQNYRLTETFNEDIIESTLREAIKKDIIKPALIDIINIVPDEVEVDDKDIFDPEAFPEKEYIYTYWDNLPEVIKDPVDIFVTVEDMPLFNGGKAETEFTRFIAQNTHYPDIASQNGVTGRVIVQFVVDTKGKVTNAEVLVPADPALDKEALRVITSSPLWTPGKQRGKPVKVKFVFPINFVLQ